VQGPRGDSRSRLRWWKRDKTALRLRHLDIWRVLTMATVGEPPGAAPLADARNPRHVLVVEIARGLPYASAVVVLSYVSSFVESAVAMTAADSAGQLGSVRQVQMALANALLLVSPGYQLCTYAMPDGGVQETCRRYGMLHLVVTNLRFTNMYFCASESRRRGDATLLCCPK
jgi:hypothetical protein